MKKAVLALILISTLLVSFSVRMQAVEVTKANFFIGPGIWIDSPTHHWVYTNTSVLLKVGATVHSDAPEIGCFLYCVDENSNLTLTNLNKTNTVDGYEFHAESVLENLAEGNHTLKVYSQDALGAEMSTSIEFTIDTHYKSPLLVLSPQNTTYSTTEVPLTFVCSEEIKHNGNITLADYLLDGFGAGYISGNLTLTDLSIGNHKIIVIVWTEKGIFSETIYFSITQPVPFPTTLVIGSLVSIGVVAIGLFVYFKKRSHARTNQHSEIEQPST
jgi:hypothetical protein